MEHKKAVQKLTFVYFNSRHKRRVAVSSFRRLAAEACEVTEHEVVASPVIDGDGDDGDGIGVEILSSVDKSLDDYLEDADELVMSPFADVSNRTETTCVGNLDENVQVEDDDSRPARDKEKETFAQKAARKALERREKERRSKHRRLNQWIELARKVRQFSRGARRFVTSVSARISWSIPLTHTIGAVGHAADAVPDRRYVSGKLLMRDSNTPSSPSSARRARTMENLSDALVALVTAGFTAEQTERTLEALGADAGAIRDAREGLVGNERVSLERRISIGLHALRCATSRNDARNDALASRVVAALESGLEEPPNSARCLFSSRLVVPVQ